MSLATQHSPRAPLPRPPSPRLRIVIADDDPDLADTLALLLSLDGHEVHCADDGRAALDLVQRVRPQVALLDIRMPLLSGYGVASAIRALPWGGQVRLIAISGDPSPQARIDAADAGFDRHLAKPVGALELLECLAALTRDEPSNDPE
ncbi:MAG TPA: response regulator [Lysobacter sp.]|nr:response regulator [Lysobacter sp.]